MNDFIFYLESKNHAATTQKAYTRNVNLFLEWYKKEFRLSEAEAINCTKKDVLKYLEHLQNNKGQDNITRRNALISINHYFTFLHKNEEVQSNPTALIKIRGTHKRHLYKIYTAEELAQLYDNYYHTFIRNFEAHCFASRLGGIPANQREQTLLSRQRNYVMLGLLVYQGLATSELQKINVHDIDTNKATVKISGSKKNNERTLPLHASQIGAIINYIENIRPQFFTYCKETDKLFFSLPESSKQKTNAVNLMHTFKPLTKQVKSIDKNLLNFKQIRASVITHWLKTEGLRKTQYYAGHRYISSTEKYLTNQIDGLIDDVAKYNPF
jgi:site-specific recombinase XerD